MSGWRHVSMSIIFTVSLTVDSKTYLFCGECLLRRVLKMPGGITSIVSMVAPLAFGPSGNGRPWGHRGLDTLPTLLYCATAHFIISSSHISFTKPFLNFYCSFAFLGWTTPLISFTPASQMFYTLFPEPCNREFRQWGVRKVLVTWFMLAGNSHFTHIRFSLIPKLPVQCYVTMCQ